MNNQAALSHCRIAAPEKLPDRFVTSGLLFQKEAPTLDQVALGYILEITKPWFPSSRVLPSLLELLAARHEKLKPGRTLADQFEVLLQDVNQLLNSLSEQGETDWIGNMNGIIVLISGNELHFSQTGVCPAYLLQNNRIRQITDDAPENDPHPLKTFSNLASGTLQQGDYVLLSNRELYREISLDALRRVMNTSTPYVACQSIVKELKHEKNLAVSSIILNILGPESPLPAEPTEIVLEEELQSRFKKIQKRLSPAIALTKSFSVAAGKAGMRTAKQTSTLIKDKAAPAAKGLASKGLAQAKHFAQKSQHQPTFEVVEVIPVKKERERLAALIAIQEEEAVEMGLEEVHSDTVEKSTIIQTVQFWLKDPRNKKIAILGLLACLVVVTASTARLRRHPESISQSAAQIDDQLTKARELNDKAATAITLKQDVEAGREISEGLAIINGLGELNDSQKESADSLWTQLTEKSDTLSKTTRLAEATSTYNFLQASSTLVTSLPYFYGTVQSSATLLRTGKGDPTNTQSSATLSDATDSIVSLTAGDGDAAYALTKKNKVYAVVQDADKTTLKAQSAAGEFATGDAISTYGGNIYILDGKSGLLWKYSGTGNGFSKGTSTIDSTKFDIKDSRSLAIDGSIFILKNSGDVLKFTSGKQEADFSLKDMPSSYSGMLQPLQVITNEDMQNLYLLDGGTTSGSRSTAKVLEFTKNGTYVRSYGFPASYTQVKAFDIDPKQKKLWLLSGSTVAEFEM